MNFFLVLADVYFMSLSVCFICYNFFLSYLCFSISFHGDPFATEDQETSDTSKWLTFVFVVCV